MTARRRQPITGPEELIGRFAVSRETANRLIQYADLLHRWQKAVNLVAPATLEHLWDRHFADSLQLLPLVPIEARTVVDIGSGAGFPGLVLAIALMERRQNPVRVTLIESDQRKAAFLRDVARHTGTPVDILSMRIENPETQSKVGQVDVVTARALAPLNRLLGLAAPYFGPHGVGLFLKGREIRREINEAREDWQFDVALLESGTDAGGRIAVVRNVAAKTEG